jgi:chitin synthase
MGLIWLILLLMAGVGFLTFGFTQTVCGKPPLRFAAGTIQNGSTIIHGYDYDLSKFRHPRVVPTFNGSTNPLTTGGFDVAGRDASFMFQNINDNCQGLFNVPANSGIRRNSAGQPQWAFPCNTYNQQGTSRINFSNYSSPFTCHIQPASRSALSAFKKTQAQGQVFYTWDQVKDTRRNLAVFERRVFSLSP